MNPACHELQQTNEGNSETEAADRQNACNLHLFRAIAFGRQRRVADQLNSIVCVALNLQGFTRLPELIAELFETVDVVPQDLQLGGVVSAQQFQAIFDLPDQRRQRLLFVRQTSDRGQWLGQQFFSR